MFGYPEYYIDETVSSMSESDAHEDFWKFFRDMARWKTFVRWMLQTNYNSLGMELHITMA